MRPLHPNIMRYGVPSVAGFGDDAGTDTGLVSTATGLVMDAANRAKLELAAAKVQAYYLAGAALLLGANASGWSAIQALSGTAVSQIQANYIQLGSVIQEWATTQLGWAENGVRDDGTSFTADRWAALGQGYMQDAQYQAGLALSSDVPAALADAATATYNQATNPLTQGPTWLKGLVIVGGLGIAAYLAKPFLEAWMFSKKIKSEPKAE